MAPHLGSAPSSTCAISCRNCRSLTSRNRACSRSLPTLRTSPPSTQPSFRLHQWNLCSTSSSTGPRPCRPYAPSRSPFTPNLGNQHTLVVDSPFGGSTTALIPDSTTKQRRFSVEYCGAGSCHDGSHANTEPSAPCCDCSARTKSTTPGYCHAAPHHRYSQTHRIATDRFGQCAGASAPAPPLCPSGTLRYGTDGACYWAGAAAYP